MRIIPQWKAVVSVTTSNEYSQLWREQVWKQSMPMPSKDEDEVQNQDCPEGYICTYARDFSNEIEVANKLLNAEYLIQNLNDKTYGAT